MGTLTYSFFNKQESSDVLSQDDEFLSSLNSLNLKYYIEGSGFSVKQRRYGLNDYKDLIKKSCQDFPQEKVEHISGIMSEIQKKWAKTLLPDIHINLCSTDGTDAFGLPYTRFNCIVLPNRLAIEGSSVLSYLSEGLLIHESFHVLSRSYPLLKKELYKVFSFYETPIFKIKEFLINPDSPLYNQAINLKTKNGKNFIGVLNLHISKTAGMYRSLDWKKIFNTNNGRYIDFKDTNLVELIGTNTDYIIHPEEICAEHFRLWMAQVNNASSDEVVSLVSEKIEDPQKMLEFESVLNNFKF